MIDLTAAASPRPLARLTGVVYLLYFLTAISVQFFMSGLIMPADAAATANNLHVHETLFRTGFSTQSTFHSVVYRAHRSLL